MDDVQSRSWEMPRRTTLSAASATPAPSLKDALELLADAIDEIIGLESLRAPQEASYRPISNARAYVAQAAAILEAPPAAERVALKAIQGKIEDMLQAISMPKGSSTEDTLRWVLSLFDAQERAGAKA